MKNQPIAKAKNIVIQEADKELLIYDLSNNKAFCLNETTAMVWQLCDGKKSTAKIGQTIANKLKTPFGDELVWLALDKLHKENLIEAPFDGGERFNNLSRREVIRKIGFASMVAIPVISSIIAPQAAMAQSGGCDLGGTGSPGSFNTRCTTTDPFAQGDCCPGLRCNNTFGDPRCENCIQPGVKYSGCTDFGVGFCPLQCNSDPLKNLCCNSGTAIVVPSPGSPPPGSPQLVDCLCP